MPFSGEHSRALGGDEVLRLLLWWGCIQWYSSSRGNPHNPTQRSHSWEHPANSSQPPCEGSHHGHDHGTHCREEASKQNPWLGQGATPLQTHSCHWTDSPFIKRPKAKALQLEFRGKAGLTPSNQGIKSVGHPVRTPLAYQGVGGCLASDAATWFHQSNCMFVEGSVTRRGLQGGPWPVEDGSIIRACHGNYEHQPHCERWGDRGDLHGHCDHFSGAGDPQWPWTGGLSPGAYHMGCHRPCLGSKQMTTFGQRGEIMTTFEQGSELITAFGQRGQQMTASGQKE